MEQAGQNDFVFLMESGCRISLLVGGVGIMNIFLRPSGKNREIGIRRALGARLGHRHATLLETMALTGLGVSLVF